MNTELIEYAKNYYSAPEVDALERAIEFASHAHEGQKRMSGEDYIVHPLAIARTLIDWRMDIDTVVAGVLHDTIEDTATTHEQIDENFGSVVVQLVDGVTKVNQARSGMKVMDEYLPQTRANLSKLLIAVGEDVRVIIIKLADRLHNLQTLEHLPENKQKKIARESLEVFAPMADRLGMGRVRMQIEDLAFRYDKPAEYKRLSKLMKDRLAKSHRRLATVQQETEDALKAQGIAFEMSGRVKSIYSVYKKLPKVGGDINGLFDLIALRIIVENKENCYRVLGLLHSLYQPVLVRIKDYIAVPKPNGYQSLHTTVITRSEQIVEFQIRTRVMHEYAERGLAASFHYNEQKLSKNYVEGKAAILPAHLSWINDLQDIASNLRSGSEEDLSLDLFADRIFVYSPKGDIYNLPEGALPLDFAYLVHSDIGHHAYGVNVNGKLQPFDKPLQNGDIVEIVTKKNSQPKSSWLQLVRTSHARTKLRAQLKKLEIN